MLTLNHFILHSGTIRRQPLSRNAFDESKNKFTHVICDSANPLITVSSFGNSKNDINSTASTKKRMCVSYAPTLVLIHQSGH